MTLGVLLLFPILVFFNKQSLKMKKQEWVIRKTDSDETSWWMRQCDRRHTAILLSQQPMYPHYASFSYSICKMGKSSNVPFSRLLLSALNSESTSEIRAIQPVFKAVILENPLVYITTLFLPQTIISNSCCPLHLAMKVTLITTWLTCFKWSRY